MNNRFCRCCFSDHNADDTVRWRLLSHPSDTKTGIAHKGRQDTRVCLWVSILASSSAGLTFPKLGAKDVF